MNFEKRLEKIETELGIGQEKNHTIILSRIPRSYVEGETMSWERDGERFEHIIIWENQGKHFVKQFDGRSEEGKKFLLERVYKQVSGH